MLLYCLHLIWCGRFAPQPPQTQSMLCCCLMSLENHTASIPSDTASLFSLPMLTGALSPVLRYNTHHGMGCPYHCHCLLLTTPPHSKRAGGALPPPPYPQSASVLPMSPDDNPLISVNVPDAAPVLLSSNNHVVSSAALVQLMQPHLLSF